MLYAFCCLVADQGWSGRGDAPALNAEKLSLAKILEKDRAFGVRAFRNHNLHPFIGWRYELKLNISPQTRGENALPYRMRQFQLQYCEN